VASLQISGPAEMPKNGLMQLQGKFDAMDTQIHLEPVTPENWRIDFKLKDEQKSFVSSPERILARAWAYREQRSKAFIIYADETPLGMAMYYDEDEMQAYDFSQFFIDSRYQGNGYGKKAASMILDMMKADAKYRKVCLCYIEGNEAARKMYENLGFKETGERDGEEIVMVKEFL